MLYGTPRWVPRFWPCLGASRWLDCFQALLSIFWWLHCVFTPVTYCLQWMKSIVCLDWTWKWAIYAETFWESGQKFLPKYSRWWYSWVPILSTWSWCQISCIISFILFTVSWCRKDHKSYNWFCTFLGLFTMPIDPLTTNSTVLCPNELIMKNTTYSLNHNDSTSGAGSIFERFWDLYSTVPIILSVIMFCVLNFKSPTFFTKFNSLGKSLFQFQNECQ